MALLVRGLLPATPPLPAAPAPPAMLPLPLAELPRRGGIGTVAYVSTWPSEALADVWLKRSSGLGDEMLAAAAAAAAIAPGPPVLVLLLPVGGTAGGLPTVPLDKWRLMVLRRCMFVEPAESTSLPYAPSRPGCTAGSTASAASGWCVAQSLELCPRRGVPLCGASPWSLGGCCGASRLKLLSLSDAVSAEVASDSELAGT